MTLEAPTPRRRADALGVLVVGGLVALTVLVVHLWAREWRPMADHALIEMRVRDVGTGATPTLGVYSRFDWMHPGPLLFYALAVPYRLLGSTSSALLVAALLINAAACAYSVAAVRRTAGDASAVAAAVVLLLFVRAGASAVIDPWNPLVAMLPFLAVCVAGWEVALGRVGSVVALVGFGSFAVQAHVGFALPLLAVGVVTGGLAFVWARAARRATDAPSRESPRRPLLVAGGLAIVVWAVPLGEQLASGSSGNLSRIMRFFTGRDYESTYGVASARRVVAQQLSAWPNWVTGRSEINPFDGAQQVDARPFPIALVLLAVLMVARRRDRVALAAGALAATVVVAAVAAVARITGPPFWYITRWVWVVGALVWVAIAVAAVRWVEELISMRGAAVQRAFVAVGMTLLGASAVAAVVSVARADVPESVRTAAVDELLAAALATGPAESERMVLAAADGNDAYGLTPALALALEREGYEVVLADDERRVGPRRVGRAAPGEAYLRVVQGEDARVEAVRTGARRVSPPNAWDEVRDERAALVTRMEAILVDPAGDRAEAERLGEQIAALTPEEPDVVLLLGRVPG